MFGYTCRVVKKISGYEKKTAEALLQKSGLIFEGSPDYTALAEDSDENVIATASLAGNVIKMVAADAEWQEAGLSSVVISALMQAARSDGIYHFFIFTKPDTAEKFAGLGFRVLAAADKSVLMECGVPDVGDYRKTLEAEREKNGGPAAAAVMNCNPFTLGHRFLIEEAASRERVFYVIVVAEDASVFPFEDRIALVRAGTADIPNVRVLSSANYAVSAATFPSYFLKDLAEMSVAGVQAELDARLFTSLFVPSLSLTRRYVGTEPFSRVTELYNETLKKILPPAGCEVTEIERKSADGTAISASRVRAAIADGAQEELVSLLPAVTLDYLNTPRGRAAAERLKQACPADEKRGSL